MCNDMKRQLTNTLFHELKEGAFRPLLKYVQNDDTLDMELRGNYFTIYYRGGAILSVHETKSGKYEWSALDEQYSESTGLRYKPEQFDFYIPEAKHIIDFHICTSDKNHLGEKEIQQLVVKENNYSPNANDTDYFIVDMEFQEGKNRFDLIALRWDSTGESRKKNKVSLAIIEVKQGIKSIMSSASSPGLRKHQKDYFEFVQKKSLDKFCNDMLEVFKQKCGLGLVRANEKIQHITRDYTLQLNSSHIDFICLLANFKEYSRTLEIEFIGMEDCKFIKSSFMGYGLYANNMITISPKYRNMKPDFREAEKQKQVDLYYQERQNEGNGIFGKAMNGGHWNYTNEKGEITKTVEWCKFILKPENSKANLFPDIQETALQYFKEQNISWWRQEEDGYFPSGHLLSSQNHCLNHLFALRNDKDAVKAIIEKTTDMQFDEILPSIIDNDPKSYISFEFALNNEEWLKEDDQGAQRGTMCTSIDAMIRARKGNKIWLVPIEWKYTELYAREDKTNRKRLHRYADLIASSQRLQTPEEGIPHSVYFIEPNYELMRQTLLCEQLVAHGYADEFVHLNIIPYGNTELRNAVECEFVPMLNDKSKFRIIDPQELLAPLNTEKELKENEDYKKLLNYLSKRYW